ncbi:MAG: hypothetical protein K0S56_85 [Microvirga sp.]|jgi:hypothetical protein|nr:hypothetical protein [Microvirga sp.]
MKRSHIAVFGLLLATEATATETQAAVPNEICRAAIGAVMGRDPSIMRTRPGDGIIYVSYKRPVDGKVWSYRCRLEGNKVFWASEEGRWRNEPIDGVITFDILNAGRTVKILEVSVDGIKSEATYPRSKLR